jgi:hypothetical protein
MKIVRLVLLLSLVGVPAACNSVPVTGPEGTSAASLPSLDGSTTPPDTTTSDGSGPLLGSGT